MRFLYSISIRIYSAILHIASLFNSKAKLMLQGRKEVFGRIKKEVSSENIVWIHAASVGEFEQAIPLIELIKKNKNKVKILVTFYSPSGYEIRKNYELADYVYYLPLDTLKNARKFLETIKPQMVFFVKYEFWFNFINEINNKNIPLYLISGIFRQKQYFFKWYGKWFTKHLKMFKFLFIQDKISAELLKSKGIINYSISGDTRFDRVNSITRNQKEFQKIKDFIVGNKVLLCGSTWPPDEAIILSYLQKHSDQLKLIIAPHEVNEGHILEIENSFKKFNPIKLSDIENGVKLNDNKVLIIDSIGKLIYLYQYADIAYIGGGFGVGIHNILEAACYGKTTIFGPNYSKFKEARDMIKIGASTSINNSEEFENCISELLDNDRILRGKNTKSYEYVHSNIGASEEIFNSCFK